MTFADLHAAQTTAIFSTAGTYELRLTADDGHLTGTGEVTLEVDGTQPETVLGSTVASIGATGDSVVLEDFAEVTVSADANRASSTITIEKIASPDLLALYNSESINAGAPWSELLRIHSSENIYSPVGLCVLVPTAFVQSLPAAQRIELFAEFVQIGADDESIATFERLEATYDAATKKACATLPPTAFSPVASVVTNVVIGSYPNAPSSTVTAQNFSPTGMKNVNFTDTVTVEGDLSFSLPPAISSPLGTGLMPTSGFGLRIHPVTRQPAFHAGIDIDVKYVPVVAAADGTVIKSGPETPKDKSKCDLVWRWVNYGSPEWEMFNKILPNV